MRSAGAGCWRESAISRPRRRCRAGSRSTRRPAARPRPRRLDRPVARAARIRLARPGGRRGPDRGGLLRAASPRRASRRRTSPSGSTPTPCAGRATGSRTACAPPPRTACSSPGTAPATASLCRARASAPPSTSGSPPAARSAPCWRASSTREEALARYGAFSHGHARAFRRALRLQRLIPALPPRVLTAALRVIGRQGIVDRAFGWYLDQAHPSYAGSRRTEVPA